MKIRSPIIQALARIYSALSAKMHKIKTLPSNHGLELPKAFIWVQPVESWRIALRKRRATRESIYNAWQKYLPNLRGIILLAIALVTLIGVYFCLPNFHVSEIAKLEKAGDATVLLALIGAPIAFVIWCFRDSNARQQIENQRKDVNLKDFQRLAEWAAGMHLPENKVTTSEKNITLTGEDIKDTATAKKITEKKNSTSLEKNTSTESAAIPASTIIHTPSRREGAASLQIAAIYQLQAFL